MTEPDLEVPQAAREEMDSLGYIKDDQAEVDAWIRSIAKPVVAAELRRLAKEYDKARRRGDEMVLPSTAFRRRADRLEGKR